jgi:YHS domain-containing protein
MSFEQPNPKAKTALPNALDGYCPVELQEKEKWIAGRAEFRTTYRGQVFNFSSAAALKRFMAAPEKYTPAQGGKDAVLAMEEDRAVSGSIQHSAVWRGRLYLFASAANLAAFREDPTRYAKHPPATEAPQQMQRAVANDKPAPQPAAHASIELEPAPQPATHAATAPKPLPQLQLPGDSL